jgi:hypothetical protein
MLISFPHILLTSISVAILDIDSLTNMPGDAPHQQA